MKKVDHFDIVIIDGICKYTVALKVIMENTKSNNNRLFQKLQKKHWCLLKEYTYSNIPKRCKHLHIIIIKLVV